MPIAPLLPHLPPSSPPNVPPPARWRFARYGRWLLTGVLLAGVLVLFVPALQRKLISRAYRFYRHYVRPPQGSGRERTPALAGYAVRGVDVSSYQGDIDWAAVAREPRLRFAFIKATEGRSWEDPYFDQNWKLTHRAGLARGAYHFYRPNRDAAQQAAFYVATVALAPGDLPPVLDVEKTDGRSPEVIRAGVQMWLRLVGRRYGVRPILYTNHDFYVRYFAGHFDDYPLWLAHYEVRQPRVGADRWTFWQHSDEALVPGIRGFVDGNVFGGSAKSFGQLLIGAAPVAGTAAPAARPPRHPAKRHPQRAHHRR